MHIHRRGIYFYPGPKSVALHPWNVRHLTSQRCCPKFMSEIARVWNSLKSGSTTKYQMQAQ